MIPFSRTRARDLIISYKSSPANSFTLWIGFLTREDMSSLGLKYSPPLSHLVKPHSSVSPQCRLLERKVEDGSLTFELTLTQVDTVACLSPPLELVTIAVCIGFCCVVLSCGSCQCPVLPSRVSSRHMVGVGLSLHLITLA